MAGSEEHTLLHALDDQRTNEVAHQRKCKDGTPAQVAVVVDGARLVVEPDRRLDGLHDLLYVQPTKR